VTATAKLIAALTAAGMDAAEAAGLVACAAVEMTGELTRKSSGAIRQKRYRERNKALRSNGSESDKSVTNRNETVTRYGSEEASRTVTEHNESVTSDAPPLSLSKKEEERKKERGATPLRDDWRPDSEQWKRACRAVGLEGAELELRTFANKAREKGATSKDWNATWDTWITRAINWAAKNKPKANTVSELDRDWAVAANSWKKFGTWPRGYGSDPESPACQCPRELLERSA